MFAFLASLVGWIWNAFQAVTDAIVYGLVVAWHLLQAFAGIIWDGAKFTYQNILKPIGVFVDKIYTRAIALYTKYVEPVVKWLDRVTATLRKIYLTVLAPILSTIDGVQRVLKLLELLHVAWAKQLDDELAALEQKLSLPLQLAIRFLNSITNRIESYVLTAENLFQRVTHLNTLRRDLGAVANIQWNSLLRNVAKKGSYQVVGPPAPVTLGDFDEAVDGFGAGADVIAGVDLTVLEQFWDETFAAAL
jgi:hypothetical protein